MSDPTAPAVFTAHLDGPDNAPVGEFGVDRAGMLTLTQVDQPFRAVLEQIAARVNDLQTLRIKAPVPNGEPGAITRKEVARDAPDIQRALVAYLEERYNIFLEPIPA